MRAWAVFLGRSPKSAQRKPVFATAYLIVVLLAAGWAFCMDATLLHAQREHLLPDIVLAVVTLPSSYSLGLLFDIWPAFFSLPFVQAGYMTLCGLVQAWLLLILTHRLLRAANAR
jgi:hypothetical protein